MTHVRIVLVATALSGCTNEVLVVPGSGGSDEGATAATSVSVSVSSSSSSSSSTGFAPTFCEMFCAQNADCYDDCDGVCVGLQDGGPCAAQGAALLSCLAAGCDPLWLHQREEHLPGLPPYLAAHV